MTTFIVPRDTALDTDWNDIHELFEDLQKFAQGNPEHTFLCADDPGFNHDPPRVARMGWVAYLEGHEDERAKCWTITVQKVRETLKRKPHPDWGDRQKMLENLRNPDLGVNSTLS